MYPSTRIRAAGRGLAVSFGLGLVASTAMAASNGVYRSAPLNHPVLEDSFGTSLNLVTEALDDSGPVEGDWDLNFYGLSAIRFWGVGTHNAAFLLNNDDEVALLNAGDVVSGTYFFSASDDGVNADPAWLAGADAYAGFRFECDGRLAEPVEGTTGYCYGYVHLVTSAGGGFPATIVDYVFDGDGNGIVIADPGFPVYENFDSVAVPALPSGWVSTASGSGSDWFTVDDDAESAPNAVHVVAPGATSDVVLDAPAYTPVAFDGEILRFWHKFYMEDGYDGAVLEISIDGGTTFQDIIAAGGQFVSGGYNDTIGSDQGSPLAGRDAWSGDSQGFVFTKIVFPPAAIGVPSILRFRMATDSSFSPSDAGWWIDNVAVGPGEADIVVEPERLVATVAQGDSIDLTLSTTNNGGIFGAWNLFTMSFDQCATTRPVPFVTNIDPESSLIGSGTSVDATVTLDSALLSVGVHTAYLCLASTDLRDPLIPIPVWFRVVDSGGGNGLFRSSSLRHSVMDTGRGSSLNLVREALDDSGPTNGDWDLNFWSDAGNLSFWGVDTYAAAFVIDGNDQVPVMQLGDSVGPASVFSVSDDTVDASPAWLAGVDGYVGFRFDCDGRLLFPVPSSVCYGYLRLASSGPDGFPATILDYAYEGDGNPITIAPGFPSLETFDQMTTPALPVGWISAATGAGADWTTVSNFSNTAPNAAYAPAFSDIADMMLDTPAFTPTAGQTIGFLHRYDLEEDYDGAVLEISTDGGATFEDILAAGGSFLSGGYNGSIVTDEQNPIAGRDAWTGFSDGYVFTEVALPPSAIGTTSILRFRTADDGSVDGGAGSGWWIDTVQLLGVPVFEADIVVDPTSLAGSAQEGTATGVGFDIGNNGTGALTWSVAASADNCASTGNVAWITAIAPGSGTIGAGDADTTVTATLDATALAAGNYDAQLCVTSNDPDEATVIVPVAFTVTTTPIANITVTPTDIAATVVAGATTNTTFAIGNTGNATLNWNVATSTDNCASTVSIAWLSATPATGAIDAGDADADVDVALDATALGAGNYTAQLCVTSNDPDEATVIVPVELTVTVPVGECVFADGFDGGSGSCS